MIDFILENKNWLFSGVGAVLLGLVVNFFTKKAEVEGVQKQKQAQNLVVNNYQGKSEVKKHSKTIPYLKDEVKIMFIDDDLTFKIIDILKTSGWKNTSIVHDVTDIDSLEVKNTHIFFVDIKGVGLWLSEKHQGLALAEKLKDKYPTKKVVIYSSNMKGDRSHPALQKADWFLPKYAEPVEFFNLIEKFTSEK
jgi:hypothetical protein